MKTFNEFMAEATDFNESISRRKVFPRALAPRQRSEDRTQNSDKAALKKAGFRRLSRRNYEPDDFPYDNKSSVSRNSPTHGTDVFSDINQANYARTDAPGKIKTSRGRQKVTPTAKRVSYLKTLRKQLGGTRTERPVHTVSINSHKLRDKNNPKELISRGKSFKQELKSLPKSLKKAGAKTGDIVVGEPSASMPGEDPKTGKEKRAKLYQKTFGSKLNPKTGLMVGRARTK